jgi:hypothetical protein
MKQDENLDDTIKINLNRRKGEEKMLATQGGTMGDNTLPLKFGSKLDINFLNLFAK